MKYTNLLKDLTTVYAEDIKHPKEKLLEEFERFINDSGYKVEKWLNTNCVPYELLIVDETEKMTHLVIYLKNITGAGWEDKPDIKRVQVTNIRVASPDNYVSTTASQTMLILGYYNYDNNPIMVAWDAYRYVKHKTNRSCYVNIDTLKRAYQTGYLITNNSSQKVWLFDSYHFSKFLEDYIAYNRN